VVCEKRKRKKRKEKEKEGGKTTLPPVSIYFRNNAQKVGVEGEADPKYFLS